MNRRRILSISAITVLGLALLQTSTVAQQKTLKEQLVGSWTLVSQEFTAPNGTKRQIANSQGSLIFDAGGRHAFVSGRKDRPKFKSASQPTTEELAAATLDYFAANFGTWSVSEMAFRRGAPSTMVFFARSSAKCEAVAALPPLPITKIRCPL